MHNDVTIAVENGVSGKLSSQNSGRRKGAKIEFAFRDYSLFFGVYYTKPNW